MVKVSVIIPAYCVEKYIAATIQSVLNQTYQDFEILIIDDGSTDRTVEICRQFQDSRIQVISQLNRGPAGARNQGIRQSKGEYLAFLDGDDLWAPEKLEKQVAHLENSPSLGISICRSAFIDEQGELLGIYQIPKLSGITPYHVLCRNPIGNGSVPVIRRAVFDEIRFPDDAFGKVEDCYFDERFRRGEDIECWLRISLTTSWEIAGIAEALTLYRVNSSGLSANMLKQLEDLEKVIAKVRSYASDSPIEEWAKPAKAYYLRYIARRAITKQDGQMAVKMFNQSLATSWLILKEEPRRTLITGAAAYLIWILPKSAYKQLENLALKMTGASQKRRIANEVKPMEFSS